MLLADSASPAPNWRGNCLAHRPMRFRRHLAIATCLAAVLALAVGAAAQSPFDIALEAGLAAMRANHYREALERFREAVAAAPDNLAALLAPGRAAHPLGEFDEALAPARSSLPPARPPPPRP